MLLNSCKIICNSCSAVVEQTSDTSCGYDSNPYFTAKRMAIKAGWVFKHRGGPTIHICPACADRVADWYVADRTKLIDAKRR